MLEVFDYPKPWPAFWAAAVLAVGYLAAALTRRWHGWTRGMPLPAVPRGSRGRVAGIWLADVFGQRQLRRISRVRWAAHLAIFWGFLGLGLLSTLHVGLLLLERLALDGGAAAWCLRGGGRGALKAWGNASGLVLTTGLLLGLARRGFSRPETGEASPESDVPLLLVLLWLTLSGFLLEGLRGAAAASPAAASTLRPWLTALWTLHGFSGLALIAWLPHSKLLHGLLAPVVIGLNARAEHARRDLS